jgi:hypothetical protein
MKYFINIIFLACLLFSPIVLASGDEKNSESNILKPLSEVHGQSIDAVLKRFYQTATVTVLDDGAKQYVLTSTTRALPYMCDDNGNYINIGMDGDTTTYTYLTDKTGIIYDVKYEGTLIKADSYGCGS